MTSLRKGKQIIAKQQDIVSAQGYGDASPVAANTTATGRAQHRRMELTLGGPAS